jgi:LysM repeat protein
MLHHPGMKLLVCFAGACAFAVLLTGCGSTGGGAQAPGTGPFDSRGNYVEAWADNPAKWRKPGSAAPLGQASDSVPEIARIEQPPMNSNPLASSASPTIISKPVPAPRVDTLAPVPTRTKPKVTAASQVVAKPRVVSKPKPKVVSKPKVKPKPAPKRYVVKSGDSLSAIASRNGTSVSALQRANGVKGTLIRPGQSLVIPK